jgi:hypothetical protein
MVCLFQRLFLFELELELQVGSLQEAKLLDYGAVMEISYAV